MGYIHPSERHEFAYQRLLDHLAAQSFHGSPAVVSARLARSTDSGTRVRVGFEPGPSRDLGAASPGRCWVAMRMTLLVYVLSPRTQFVSSSPNALQDSIVADEVRSALSGLVLSFYDYTDSAAGALLPGSHSIVVTGITARTANNAAYYETQLRATVAWRAVRDSAQRHVAGGRSDYRRGQGSPRPARPRRR